MSIFKRFSIFLFIEFLISAVTAVFIITWIIRESPAIVQEVETVQSQIVAHFTVLGYEEHFYSGWIRPDPLDNVDSRLHIEFYNRGTLELIKCESGYVNTQSASRIYADMEATIQAMGGSLLNQKTEIIRVIDEIKNDQPSRTSAKSDNIKWSIESNTYEDGQGGKLRYICFNASAKYEK